METNLRKWSSMLYVLCLAMVMTMMPITTDAAETRDLVVTTSTKKQQDTSIEQLNAGAAVLVDVDVAMNDADLPHWSESRPQILLRSMQWMRRTRNLHLLWQKLISMLIYVKSRTRILRKSEYYTRIAVATFCSARTAGPRFSPAM